MDDNNNRQKIDTKQIENHQEKKKPTKLTTRYLKIK